MENSGTKIRRRIIYAQEKNLVTKTSKCHNRNPFSYPFQFYFITKEPNIFPIVFFNGLQIRILFLKYVSNFDKSALN